MITEIVQDVIELVKLEPEIADTVSSWFASNPNATPEAIVAKLAEYRDEVMARRQAVADAHARVDAADAQAKVNQQ